MGFVLNKDVHDLSKNTILLIDEDHVSCLLIQEILTDYNIKFIIAKNGEMAIPSFETNKNIGLIISDILLPDISGFDLLKELRIIDPSIPVIAQTAYVYKGLEEKCLKAGFNEFITKPIDLELFESMVKKYVLLYRRRN